MAGAAFADVEGLGVRSVDAAEEGGEGAVAFGEDDEVDVIRHEAIGDDASGGIGEVFADEAELERAVRGGEEHALAIGAALGDVVGEAGDDDAGIAGHLAEIAALCG